MQDLRLSPLVELSGLEAPVAPGRSLLVGVGEWGERRPALGAGRGAEIFPHASWYCDHDRMFRIWAFRLGNSLRYAQDSGTESSSLFGLVS